MYQKVKELAINSENLAKNYTIENKILILSSAARAVKKKGDKNMRLMYVKLLKTNIEKMSTFRLSIILMKINELENFIHYVYEKKGERR